MKKYLFTSVVIILAVQALAITLSWYTSVKWFDIPMHLIGGTWTGFLFFYLFEVRWHAWRIKENGFWMTLIVSLGFVALIGVLWEFHEHIVDVFVIRKYGFFEEQAGTLVDTLGDLFNDLVGGTVATVAWYIKHRRLN